MKLSSSRRAATTRVVWQRKAVFSLVQRCATLEVQENWSRASIAALNSFEQSENPAKNANHHFRRIALARRYSSTHQMHVLVGPLLLGYAAVLANFGTASKSSGALDTHPVSSRTKPIAPSGPGAS